MRFWCFAEGTSRGSGESAFSRQKTSGSDLHQSCLTFFEESQEDKTS